MLRHSISQVFGNKHPAFFTRENDDIRQPRSSNSSYSFPSQTPHQLPNGTNTNVSYLNPSSQLLGFEESVPMPPTPMLAPMPAPAFEAVPLPNHMPPAPIMIAQRDASNLHPVFFTERLRRSPLILDAVAVTSPVAHGYDYPNTHRRADGTVQAML